MVHVSLKISDEDAALLRSRAEAAGVSVTGLVRLWLRSPVVPDSTVLAGPQGSGKVPSDPELQRLRELMERLEDLVNVLPEDVVAAVSARLAANDLSVADLPLGLVALAAVPHPAEPAPPPAPALGEDDQSRGWA